MRSVRVFGKSIPILAIVAIAMTTGMASAALLTHYGRIRMTADVQQSVLVDGNDHTELITDVLSKPAPGGETFCFKHTLTNQASVPATVEFETSYRPRLEDDEITTTIYSLPLKTTLTLEDKDASWNPITGNDRKAVLTFDTVHNKFKYELEVTDLEDETEYALIYYADYEDRFAEWGGDNPGYVITTFTTDGNGDKSVSGNVNLGMNLPHPNDWNGGPDADYTQSPDSYVHGKGAKLWIVPTSDLTDDDKLPLDAWNPSKYLFETDLIVYLDCNLGVEPNFPIETGGTAVTEITIPAGETVHFCICYSFDIAIASGIYTIMTKIVPA